MVKKRHSSKLARLSHKRNKEEGKNEELKKVKFKELLALNKPDWPFVVVGVIASAFIGIFFPAMAPLFSELLRVGHTQTHAHTIIWLLSCSFVDLLPH